MAQLNVNMRREHYCSYYRIVEMKSCFQSMHFQSLVPKEQNKNHSVSSWTQRTPSLI